MKTLMIFVALLFSTAVAIDAADSSFTQADRDRMLRLEVRLEEGLKAINQKMDDGLKATNQIIDDLRGLIYVMISVTISGMFVLVGFILWDRRTTLAPVTKTTKELEARTDKLELAIKEKAEKDPELKEALRHAGLL
ncbi:MAG: hypothetical protein HQL06_07210 [Nitrospirae bacterium]|nr:hypothetical protein [Nitrospirota bacterium]